MNLKFQLYLFFLTSISIVLHSCTIEKRHYRSGYHVEWKSWGKNQLVKAEAKERVSAANKTEQAETSLEASVQETIISTVQNVAENKITTSEDCDIIILKNGDEISGVVTEVGLQEIKYKKCNNPDGPSYVLAKNDVFMIKYANGSKDIINPIGQQERKSIVTEPSPTYYDNTSAPPIKHNQSSASVSKSQPWALWVAEILYLLACILAVDFSFFFGLIIFCLIAGLIFNIIAISQIASNPDKYDGMGWAIFELVVMGIVFFAILLI